jgi:hypothetical protein
MGCKLIAWMEFENADDAFACREAIMPWSDKMFIRYNLDSYYSRKCDDHLNRIIELLGGKKMTIGSIHRHLRGKYTYKTTYRDVHKLILRGNLERVDGEGNRVWVRVKA